MQRPLRLSSNTRAHTLVSWIRDKMICINSPACLFFLDFVSFSLPAFDCLFIDEKQKPSRDINSVLTGLFSCTKSRTLQQRFELRSELSPFALCRKSRSSWLYLAPSEGRHLPALLWWGRETFCVRHVSLLSFLIRWLKESRGEQQSKTKGRRTRLFY